MNTYCNYSQLNDEQRDQYQKAIPIAFPPIIVLSQHIKNYWPRLEEYFPESQLFLLDQNKNLIGFMNTVPLYWDQALSELPQNGWDWMLQKGIEDYENKIKPNTLGGLQVIITQEHLRKGYSKLLLAEIKNVKKALGLQQLIIPIRPILKSQSPEMPMKEYMLLKKGNKVFDPWIRTHLDCGAKISHVCEHSMHVYGNQKFWEGILKKPVINSGKYIAPGALNPINIEIEKDYGEYIEENIWISYD